MKIVEEFDVSMEVMDSEGQLLGLFDHIRSLTRSGHSFNVVVDPVSIEDISLNEDGKIFYIDGDGADQISKLDIKEIPQEDK